MIADGVVKEDLVVKVVMAEDMILSGFGSVVPITPSVCQQEEKLRMINKHETMALRGKNKDAPMS